MNDRPSRWQIDKHVPLALIVTIAVQTAGIIWFAAKMDARVERLEERSVTNAGAMNALVSQVQDNGKRLVRVETLIEMQTKTIRK